MKAYADINALHNVLTDEEFKALGNGAEIEKLLHLASLKIDAVTFNRIIGRGFENLTPFQQSCVREACCYQAYKISCDGVDGNEAQSFSVGDISITAGNGKSPAQRLGLSAEAYLCLDRSGLMQRVI